MPSARRLQPQAAIEALVTGTSGDTTLPRTLHCHRRSRRLTSAVGQRSVARGTLAQDGNDSRGSGGEPGRRVTAGVAAALVQGERGIWQESI
jgi:hypothetical protein